MNIDERPLPPSRKRRRKPKDNEPDFDLRLYLYQMAGVDLTEIDGVNVLTAQVVLSEIGTDMSKWPTVKHFTSWLGLYPHNDKTGGKVIRTRNQKTQNRAAAALRMGASALSHSHSALGVIIIA